MRNSEIAQMRIYNQQISHPSFEKPEQVVRWMTAIQAQNYYASLWAIGLRTSPAAGITEPDIEQAVAEKKIVRTWPMRGTLHFVAAEDVRWMLELLTPRVIRSAAGRYRGLELDEATFKKSRDLLEKALLGGKQLINSELYDVLEQAGISTEGQRGYHILTFLAMKGVICMGLRRGKQHTFTLLEEWLPAAKNLQRDEVLGELARRFISSHGPATDYDFAAWAGLTLKDARMALDISGPEFAQTETGGKTFWFSEETESPAKASSDTYFLPAFDEILSGYKDRSVVLRSDQNKDVILKNGIFKPVMIMNHKVTGSWKRILKKESVVLEMEPFMPLKKEEIKRLRQASLPYGRFLGMEIILTGVGDK
ncbi:MAG: winged helix DNA-binding domain-containing protein [Balneolaceae bacterium]